MAHVQQQVILKPYNTFGLSAKAAWWLSVSDEKIAIEWLLDNPGVPVFVLGGGSNILLTKDVNGLVLHNDILGKDVVREDKDYIFLKVGAGENWHQLVMYCVERNWGGIENLSLIPGRVGAAPIQNIGAYGVELQEVFESLEAINLQTGVVHAFFREECDFGYRDSIFKRQYKGQFLITRVVLKLRKHPVLNTAYGAIKEELEHIKGPVGIREVSDAVCRIRRRKLPDPAEIGNAGSFFKNPVISREKFSSLVSRFPDIPHYPEEDGAVKIPAAWLIQTCGWKGRRFGTYGVHDKQALVLVNFGGATGQEIYDLSERILQSVEERFGIRLEREVNVL